MSNMDLIVIKQEPQEDIEKYSNPEIEQGIIPIELKQEEDVTSFLIQHQFIFDEDVDIKKEHAVLSALLHDHDYLTIWRDSSFCEEQCGICSSSCVTSITNFITEKESSNNSLVTLKCAHCDFITNHKQYLISHMKVCNNLKEFRENYTLNCKSNALEAQTAKNPFNLSHSLSKFTHEQCYNGNGLHNFEQFKCDRNDFMSSYKKFLSINQRDSMKNKSDKCDYTLGAKYIRTFICGHCNYRSFKKCDLVEHVKSAHKYLKQFICDQCGFVGRSKTQLVSHTKSQHSLTKYKCDHCNYVAKSKRDLARHVTIIRNSKQYSCYQCGFAATLKKHLVSHIKSHHGLTEYKCANCNYASMPKNMNDCRGFKKFTCEKCNYASSRKRDLVQHFKSQFNCAECGFALSSKDHFVSHMKIQHGSVEYKCDKCKYTSISRNNLYQHIRYCHGLKNIACAQCNYRTTRKFQLDSHVKRIHNFKQLNM